MIKVSKLIDKSGRVLYTTNTPMTQEEAKKYFESLPIEDQIVRYGSPKK